MDAATQELIDQAVKSAVANAGTGMVKIASKPGSIENLKKTWRASAEHLREQAWRFLRLFVVTLAPQLIALALAGQSLTADSLRTFVISVAVPAAEVVWRQLHPALTASAVDSADGVTIVPEQVGEAVPPVEVASAPVDVAPAPVDTATPATPVDGDAAP